MSEIAGLLYLYLAYRVGSFASNRGLGFVRFFLSSVLLTPVVGFIMAKKKADETDTPKTDSSSPKPEASPDEAEPRAEPTTTSASPETPSGSEADGSGAIDESDSADDSLPSEESAPSEDLPASEESVIEGDSLDAAYEEDTSDRTEDGKVRCDTCYSFVDESVSECPACGSSMDSGSGFF